MQSTTTSKDTILTNTIRNQSNVLMVGSSHFGRMTIPREPDDGTRTLLFNRLQKPATFHHLTLRMPFAIHDHPSSPFESSLSFPKSQLSIAIATFHTHRFALLDTPQTSNPAKTESKPRFSPHTASTPRRKA